MKADYAFRCERCGCVAPEQEWSSGENSPYDRDYTCPDCGYEGFDEVFECELCGEWHTINEMSSDVCDKCLGKLANVETVREYGYAHMVEVRINPLYEKAFTPSQIDEILRREFDAMQDKDVTACMVAMDDPANFVDWCEMTGRI